MRTTVDMDEELLLVVKHLAQEQNETIGRIIGDLIRKGLQPARSASRPGRIPTLPRKPGARPVTAQAVKDLLEAE